ncbi:hypothetical protein CYY_006598 [Polysphondylium violaceum]|uniref:Uncharacterized protein n=1 Tax=Polysphondylium violaceum TaxID=133409 RepID=A0A8J4PQB9_9MYCE|nr:hypothetical protein CYY_006598 [Polysphondylium violaceum]
MNTIIPTSPVLNRTKSTIKPLSPKNHILNIEQNKQHESQIKQPKRLSIPLKSSSSSSLDFNNNNNHNNNNTKSPKVLKSTPSKLKTPSSSSLYKTQILNKKLDLDFNLNLSPPSKEIKFIPPPSNASPQQPPIKSILKTNIKSPIKFGSSIPTATSHSSSSSFSSTSILPNKSTSISGNEKKSTLITIPNKRILDIKKKDSMEEPHLSKVKSRLSSTPSKTLSSSLIKKPSTLSTSSTTPNKLSTTVNTTNSGIKTPVKRKSIDSLSNLSLDHTTTFSPKKIKTSTTITTTTTTTTTTTLTKNITTTTPSSKKISTPLSKSKRQSLTPYNPKRQSLTPLSSTKRQSLTPLTKRLSTITSPSSSSISTPCLTNKFKSVSLNSVQKPKRKPTTIDIPIDLEFEKRLEEAILAEAQGKSISHGSLLLTSPEREEYIRKKNDWSPIKDYSKNIKKLT